MAEEVGIRIELENVSSVIRSMSDLNKEVKLQKKILEENFEVGTDGYKNQEKLVAALQGEQQKLRKELRNQKKQYLDVEKTATGSYRAINKELINARKRFKELSRAERDGKIGQDLTKQIQKLDTELKEIDASIGQYQRNVGNYSSAFNGLGDVLSNLGGTAGNAGSNLQDIGSILGKGGLVGAAAAAGVALFKVGQEVGKIVNETIQLRREISKLTKQTGNELSQTTQDVQAISRTFNVEQEEVFRAANSLSQQLGISTGEALDRIEDGFLAGANSSGEYLDNLREYSAQAKNVGLTAQELNEVLVISEQQGIFSDKGIDAVKEFGLRVTDLTPAIKKDLDSAFGTGFADNLERQIESGALSVRDAMTLVSQELNNTELTAGQTQKVISGLFGSAGEDAGADFVKRLKDVDGNLDNITDSTNKYTQAQKAQLDANKALAAEHATLTDTFEEMGLSANTFGTQLQTGALRILNKLLEIIKPLIPTFKEIGNTLRESLTYAFNRLMKVIRPLLPLFQKVGEVLSTTLKNSFEVIKGVAETVAPVVEGALNIIVDALSAITDTVLNVQETFSSGIRSVTDYFGITRRESNLTKAELQELYDEVARGDSLFGDLGKKFNAIISKSAKDSKAEMQELVTFINNIGKAGGRPKSDDEKPPAAKPPAKDKSLDLEKMSLSELTALYEKLNASAEKARKKGTITNEQLDKLEKVKKILSTLEEDADLQALRKEMQSVANQLTQIEKINSDELQIESNVKINALDIPELPVPMFKDGRTLNEIIQDEIKKLPESIAVVVNELYEQVGDAIVNALTSNIDRQKEQLQNFRESEKTRIAEFYDTRLALAKGNTRAEAFLQKKRAEEEEALRKKAAKKEKQIAVKEAIILGGKAVLQALAGNPFPIPAVPLAAVAAAQTAVQIANIKAQEFEQGGIIKGKSHAQGGVPIYGQGGKIAEVEGGEAIMSRKATAMFTPQLSAMNQAAGGASFFRDGGILNSTPAFSSFNASAQLPTQSTQQVTQPVLILDEFNDKNKRFEQVRNLG